MIHEKLAFDVGPLYLLSREIDWRRKIKFLVGVRFDIERGAGGFARYAAGDVFTLAGCGIRLKKHTLHRHAKSTRHYVVSNAPSDRSPNMGKLQDLFLRENYLCKYTEQKGKSAEVNQNINVRTRKLL